MKTPMIFAQAGAVVTKNVPPHMIKSLSLVPMQPLDAEGTKLIFQKDGNQ